MHEKTIKDELLSQFRSACLSYARECRSFTAFKRKDNSQRSRLNTQKERILSAFKSREFGAMVWAEMLMKRKALRLEKARSVRIAEKRMLRLKVCVDAIW